jgi:hypothetical protein
MTDPSLEPILAYLRKNSGRFSEEALRGELVRNGYDPAAVDQAIAVYRQEVPPSRAWPKTLGVVALDGALLVLVILLIFSGGGSVDDTLLTGLGGLYGLQLLAGIVMSIPATTRRWGLALFLGFLLFVGLSLLILTGICLVASKTLGRI